MRTRIPLGSLVLLVITVSVPGQTLAQESGSQESGAGSGEGEVVEEGPPDLDLSQADEALRDLEDRLRERTTDGSQGQGDEAEDVDPRRPGLSQRETLPIFGMKLFAPRGVVRDPFVSVTDDYVLGPGDSLRIRFWNSQVDSAAIEYPIDRDGFVSLSEKIGQVHLAGLRFGEAREILEKEIRRAITDPSVVVTMGRLRSIHVWVTGYVANPGYLSVSALATVFNALLLAGGPGENGTLRAIQVIRAGEIVSVVDVYDFLLRGDRSADVRLRADDTIFVPSRGPRIRVEGEVKMPALYELSEKTDLFEALEMAGGLTGRSYRALVQLERTSDGRRRVLRDYALDDAARTVILEEADVVRVGTIVEGISNHVTLDGHVERPGRYEWQQNLVLSELLRRGGPILPQTWMERGLVFRSHGDETSFRHVPGVRSGVQDHQTLPFDVGAVLAGEEDLVLERQDRVVIYRRDEVIPTPTVEIRGAVRRPGSFELTSGIRVKDLVFLAGGLLDDAFLGDAILVRRLWGRPDAEASSVERLRFSLLRAMDGDESADHLLENFDIVHVLRRQDEAVTVTVEGAVKHAGTYILERGARLSDLLREAGGPSRNAFLKGAVFIRHTIRLRMQEARDEYVRHQRERLLAVEARASSRATGPTERATISQTIQVQTQLLQQLQATTVVGRLPLKGLDSPLFSESPFDVELVNGDRLDIPMAPDSVQVLGRVASAGAVLWVPGQPFEFYLARVGGAEEDADLDAILLIKADGEVIRRYDDAAHGIDYDSERRIWIEGRVNEFLVERGDVVYVPPEAAAVSGWDATRDIVDIVFKTAVAAGVAVGALK